MKEMYEMVKQEEPELPYVVFFKEPEGSFPVAAFLDEDDALDWLEASQGCEPAPTEAQLQEEALLAALETPEETYLKVEKILYGGGDVVTATSGETKNG